MNTLHRAGLVALALVMASSVSAKKNKTYNDPKDRFTVGLPSGWSASPVPGESSGMVFKLQTKSRFAIIRVEIVENTKLQTVDELLTERTARIRDELSARVTGRSEVRLGDKTPLPVLKLETQKENGSRSIRLAGFMKFNRIHILRYDSPGSFRERDFEKFAASYLASRPKEKRVRGFYKVWRSLDGGPTLALGADNIFLLGELEGVFYASPGRLRLRIPTGTETYRVTLDDDVMVLESPNLDGPSRYQATGSTLGARDEKLARSRTAKEVSALLIGEWDGEQRADALGRIRFRKSGVASVDGKTATWRYRRGRLHFRFSRRKSMTFTMAMSDSGKILTLTDAKSQREHRLQRSEAHDSVP